MKKYSPPIWLVYCCVVLFVGCSMQSTPFESLGQELVGDCSVEITTYPSTQQNQGTTISLGATATCASGTAEYKYYLRNPAGSWSVARDWDASSSFSWDTTGQTLGSYLVQVWVRRQGETIAYEGASAVRPITLIAAPADTCVVQLMSYPTSPVFPGASLSFSASGGCSSGTAEYKYYLRNPDGNWFVARDWDPSNNFAWNSTGQKAGAYLVQVWVRRQGQTVAYQAASIARTFTLEAGSGICSAVAMTYTENAATYTFQFTPTCATGVVPEYQVVYKAPASYYKVVRSWSPQATYSWNSSTAMTGTHTYQVWVRATGSSATQEGIDSLVLYKGTCTNPTAVPLPLGPQTLGNTISWTFGATCDANLTAEYKFYHRPPGGSWSIMRDWSTTTSFSWLTDATTQIGQHTFQLWMRTNGTNVAYSAVSPIITYEITASNPGAATVEDFHANQLQDIFSLTRDNAGNLYFSGSSSYDVIFGSTTLGAQTPGSIGYLSKRDSNGNWLWARKFQASYYNVGSYEYYAYARTNTIDSQGNIYVVGSFYGSMGSFSSKGYSDEFIAKYDPQGTQLWIKQIGTSSGEFIPTIQIGSNDRLYVVGYHLGAMSLDSISLPNTTSNYQGFIGQMDTNGNWLWAKQISGASKITPQNMKLDSNGNAYVVGKAGNQTTFGSLTLGTSQGYFLAKIDATGTWKWVHTLKYYPNMAEHAGNIYLSSNFSSTITIGSTILNPVGSNDLYVAKFDTNGSVLWIKTVDSSTGLINPLGMDTDNQGNLYMTQRFINTINLGNITLSHPLAALSLTKINAQGTWVHAQKITASTGTLNSSMSVLWVANGRLYLKGEYSETLDFGGYTLLKKPGKVAFLWTLPAP